MSHLQIAALVAAGGMCLTLGIFIGCLVNGERKDTGLLSAGMACLCAAGAVTFWLL